MPEKLPLFLDFANSRLFFLRWPHSSRKWVRAWYTFWSGGAQPLQYHAVSANRILWVYAGFWWYHGILVVHLQDSVGAFGAKWLTKWLHHAKAPPHRGVRLWEWGNKDVHLVTTFVFCHVSKCYFFQQEFHCENVSAKCRSLVQVTPIESDFEVIFM